MTNGQLRTPNGFRWWADRNEQTVEVVGQETGPDGEIDYAVSVRTELLRSLHLGDGELKVINGLLMGFASMAGPVYDQEAKTLSLCSLVRVHKAISKWMNPLISVAAVLQIGEARIMGSLLAKILNAEEALSGPPHHGLISQVRAVITVPASLNAEARRETRDAAIDAGLNRDLIELIDEPVAALLHLLNEPSAASVLSMEEPRNILVFDYGGGTLDLCLVKCRFNLDAPTGVQAETLAISQYRRNGGNDVDRAVMDEVMWPQVEQWIGKQRDELPADLRQAVDDTLTSTLARRLKEKLCTKIRKEMTVDGKAYPRVRGSLSETVPTGAEFFDDRLPKSIRGTFKITKEQFDNLMRPFLRVPLGESDPASLCSIIAPIRHCLEKAGLSPEDLDALVLHGGSCRNPYVVHHLKELFMGEDSLFGRTTITQTPDLDTSVACGAALACYWKHERSVELIKPVTAEDIGIITLGGSAECLVRSGTPLRAEKVIGDYAETAGAMREIATKVSYNQPGDPVKLAAVIVRLAASPQPPVHLPLGNDTLKHYRE